MIVRSDHPGFNHSLSQAVGRRAIAATSFSGRTMRPPPPTSSVKRKRIAPPREP
ncbi:hypothetical protein HRbin41_01286 [bacterium HR41]|nr:hypothetical protein HRbin41_01286 [bacterium HR41]